MARKTDPKSQGLSAIQKQKQELEAQAARLKVALSQTTEFLQKAPVLKEQAQRKEQRAIFDRFNRPARLEGPVDFHLDNVRPRNTTPPKRLRRERRTIPWFTLLLLVIFGVVAYYAWTALWKG